MLLLSCTFLNVNIRPLSSKLSYINTSHLSIVNMMIVLDDKVIVNGIIQKYYLMYYFDLGKLRIV